MLYSDLSETSEIIRGIKYNPITEFLKEFSVESDCF